MSKRYVVVYCNYKVLVSSAEEACKAIESFHTYGCERYMTLNITDFVGKAIEDLFSENPVGKVVAGPFWDQKLYPYSPTNLRTSGCGAKPISFFPALADTLEEHLSIYQSLCREQTMKTASQKGFTYIIEEEYNKRGFHMEPTQVKTIPPIIPLSPDQLEQLNKGDGQKTGQFAQINSSTGLCVNYYKILESTRKVSDLMFEEKVALPLQRGRSTNLDATFTMDRKRYFIESKFLEPYYSRNESNTESYYEPDKYTKEVRKDIRSKWIELFEKAERFEYYNVAQLCRHLLSIYRYMHGLKGSSYQPGQQVILQSVTWKMTDSFLSYLSDRHEMEQRINKLYEEAERCQALLNAFIQDISWNNMLFECIKYNDIIGDLKESKYYREFCERYFLDL